MKVCHLTSVHPAEDIRILIKECQTLRDGGHEVVLVVANEPSRDFNGVAIVGVPSPAGNRLLRMVKSPAKVYKAALKQDADVYHFHDSELIPVGLLLKRKGKKVIYDVHEDLPEQVLSKHWIPKVFRKTISKMVKWAEKYAAKRFDAIVTATPTISKRFNTYNSNTETVHNFPILSELITGTELDRKNNGENNIIYIGGITVLRGIKESVRALEKVNDADNKVTLFLAGRFSPEGLKAEIEQYPGWRHVRYLGWLDRDGVKKYLSESKLGLVILHPEPRYVVSYPIKLFEYMSAGIPVIASRFPLWESIVKEEDCGICVDPLNPEEIAEAIKQLLSDPARSRRMGENGRKAVERKYNWENEGETLLKLYSELDTHRKESRASQ